MKSKKIELKPLVLSVLLIISAAGAAEARDDVMSDFDKIMDRGRGNSENDPCQRALNSKHFDNWLKAYAEGKDSDADREWVEVLKCARGTNELKCLVSGVSIRLHFLDDTATEQVEKRSGLAAAHQSLLHSTEAHLGKDSLALASMLGYLAEEFYDSREWARSAEYSRRALLIQEKAWGKNSPKLAYRMLELAKAQVMLKQYKEARTNALRALPLVKASNSKRLVERAKAVINSASPPFGKSPRKVPI
ncbi:MAG: tetratricopeptide repeat protein [Candidatus Obscuribacter sp.]|mgnify:CR=1 FL=1|nr:tetratricopeptide repeat protein [Candidatus Obscuribacter sp.]MBK9279533.1 tetratricopeptide repeat protein [Candidatus Obscuribacter sp.]